MNQALRRGAAAVIVSAALTLTVGTGVANASDPTGGCEPWEVGVMKIDGPTGSMYECQEIDIEGNGIFGLYWMPVGG